MDASTEIISGLIGLAAGIALAIVKGALDSRAKESEELRQLRIEAYKSIWKLTSAVARWPKQHPSFADFWVLHLALRDWYYQTGGLYLSENARARYGDLQELLDAYLSGRAPDDSTPVPRDPDRRRVESPYDALMKTASDFRTALTEDLATRRARSVYWTYLRWRLHRLQAARAKARIAAAGVKSPPKAGD